MLFSMRFIFISVRKRLAPLVLLLVVTLLSGCASTGSVDNDPLEKMNRAITKFNLAGDRAILAPIARGYTKVLPKPVRNGINNFLANLREPYNVLNNLLQGQLHLAGQDTGRFLINTTLGFFGLNDVASYMGMPRRREDFGQTLAVWGVPAGPHVVLPFLGPSNLRDTAGLIPDFTYSNAANVDTYPADLTKTVTGIVDARSQVLGLEEILDVQSDKYLFLREGYRQRRALAISNGRSSDDESTEEELLEELLEDNKIP